MATTTAASPLRPPAETLAALAARQAALAARLDALAAETRDPRLAALARDLAALADEAASHSDWGEPDLLSGCWRRPARAYMNRRHPSDGSGGLVGVISVDLDDLKRLNDAYGHVAGDELIAQAGEILRSACRAGDAIAIRDGGDEFSIIAEGANTPQAIAAMATRLEQALTQAGIAASIGTAVQVVGRTVEQTIHQADQVMYREKQRHHAREGYER